MSQQVYNRYMGLAVPGLIADSEYTAKDGLQAFEAIGLGLGVVQRIGYPNQGRLPKSNKSTILFAGDLITANVVNLKIGGVAMAPVTFNTDNATTLGLIVTAIKAVAGVANATTDGVHTIVVYGTDGLDALVTDIVVTAGATQTTGAATVGTTDVIYGISIMSQAIEQVRFTGVVAYTSGAPVGCLLKGRIWVMSETAVVNGDPVYLRFKGDGATKFAGQFRNDADSGTATLVTGAIFRTIAAAPGLAVIDINEPQ